jgi:copper chaperone CopZ
LRIAAGFVRLIETITMRTKTAILSITNLKADDLATLRDAFNAVPGVEKVDFSLERSVAVLDFDPTQSHIDDFLRAVLKAGFQVE